jgi:hypothetical protein
MKNIYALKNLISNSTNEAYDILEMKKIALYVGWEIEIEASRDSSIGSTLSTKA